MRGLDPARDVARESHHLAQVDGPGVHLVDRRHSVPAHAHRRKPRVGQGFAEPAELAPDLRLPLGIGHGSSVGGIDALGEDALEVRDVGFAEPAAEIARRDHVSARQHADAEAQDGVLARALGVAVLRGRVLALDGLEAHVGVPEVRARRGA